MKELLDKLIEIEKDTSLQRGAYNLFALFLRENSLNKWDILISAHWIDSDKGAALKYLAEKIQNELSTQELLLISRIVIIDEFDPALASFQQAVNVMHGNVEIKDSNFFGLQIKHAFLLTSKSKQVA